eukprot:GDKJ01000570.1.p1 GENE.GDKJ01000570.1~~GDKJ01000570.1.p1  ORF type:complete len:697 (+),score=182.29 GDKJ01000570.1:29-2119(+)
MATGTRTALFLTILSVLLVLITMVVVLWKTFISKGVKVVEYKLDFQLPNAETLANAKQPVIYFASESGNAEEYANNFAQSIKDTIGTIPVKNLSDFEPNDFIVRRVCIFIVSTFGDGESPENARSFDHFIQKSAENAQFSLQHMQIAVFGLGDSSYAQYNEMAKRLHKNLITLGATEICPLGMGDASQDSKGMFSNWTSKHLIPLLPHAIAYVRKNLGFGSQLSQIGGEDEAPLEIVFAPTESEILRMYPSAGSFNLPLGLKGFNMTTKFFFEAPEAVVQSVIEVRSGANEAANETTKRVTFGLPPNFRGKYSTAGTLDILPQNDPSLVNLFVKYISLPEGVSLQSILAFNNNSDSHLPPAPHPFPSPISVSSALGKYVDLTFPLDSESLSLLSPFVSAPSERANLDLLSSKPSLYAKAITDPKLTLLEMLESFFPSIQIPLLDFLMIIPKMKVRSYSISSSPFVSPASISLTINKETTHHVHVKNLPLYIQVLENNGLTVFPCATLSSSDRILKGVASSFFTNAQQALNQSVLFKIKDSAFKMPTDGTSPILLLAAGSGLAPILSILEELSTRGRAHPKIKTKNPTTLIFGCRHPEKDLLSKPLLDQWEADDTLSRVHFAFSRVEGKDKIYVQDRIRLESEEIRNFLMKEEKKCMVMICGSPSMGKSAEEALREVVGHSVIDEMKISGRYQVEFF